MSLKSTSVRGISGQKWLDKFDRSNDEDYIAARKAGVLAISFLGGIGLINSVFSVWVWFYWLSDYRNNTDFWFAWFGPYLLNGLLWIPITILWPIIGFGGTVMIRFAKIFAQSTLTGAFFGYWANVAAMYYAFYMEPVKSESTFEST